MQLSGWARHAEQKYYEWRSGARMASIGRRLTTTESISADNADFIPPLVLDMKNSQNLYFGTFRLYQTTNGGTELGRDYARPDERRQQQLRDYDQRGAERFEYDLCGNFRWADLAIGAGAEGATGHSHGEPEQPAGAQRYGDCGGFGESEGGVRGVFRFFLSWGKLDATAWGTCFLPIIPGASWLQVDGNLPDVPVNDIVIDPTDATDNTIYIATDSGVYASANATAGGATIWSVLQTGLPNSQVLALQLRNASRTAGGGRRMGAGLWSLLLPNLPGYRADGAEPGVGDHRFGIFSAYGHLAMGSRHTP